MTVSIISETAGYGVLTDCADEKRFLKEFSYEAYKFLIQHAAENYLHVFVPLDDGDEQVTGDSADLVHNAVAPEDAEPLGVLLVRFVEIVSKYRGYKSGAKERKEIYSGDEFPSLHGKRAEVQPPECNFFFWFDKKTSMPQSNPIPVFGDYTSGAIARIKEDHPAPNKSSTLIRVAPDDLAGYYQPGGIDR